MNNDFQRFGNELTAYVKKNNFSFSRIIFEKRQKKKKEKTTVDELIQLASRKISIFFTCRIKTGTRFHFHAEDESETSSFYTVSFQRKF